MLYYAPILREDELLYGWMTRYHDHTGSNSSLRSTFDLFGFGVPKVQPDFPTSLSKLYCQISWFKMPSLETLAFKHTLLSYYTFFSGEIKKREALSMMEGSDGRKIHSYLGLTRTVVNRWSHLRYCTRCWEEDRGKYGERHWRVSHQLPKVYYCPTHQVPLLNSEVVYSQKRLNEFYSAEGIVMPESLPTSPVFNTKTEEVLKWLSTESKQLLEQSITLNEEDLRHVYKFLLYRKGYTIHHGKINYADFAQDFTDYYGEECLEVLQSKVNLDNQSCWMRNMIKKTAIAVHPLRHLLLLRFFEVPITQLESLKGRRAEPFGPAPYICLNAAAEHYGKRVITRLKVKRAQDGKGIRGLFTCECGFAYSRTGPDTKESDCFRFDRVNRYGPVWETVLRKLLKEEKLSGAEVAERLQVTLGVIYEQTQYMERADGKEIEKEVLKKEKETEWLSLIEVNQEAGTIDLQRLAPTLYLWHYRNNREWLKKNPKRVTKVKRGYQKLDWVKRDNELAKEIMLIVQEMLEEAKPVRLSHHGITQRIKHPRKIPNWDRLPKSQKVLKGVVETSEEFRIRRIRWACQEISRRDERLNKSSVRMMAGLMSPQSETVMQTIDEELSKYN